MTEPLLTISAFARAVDLAPSTLRYYDEAGLLPPSEVDVRTGYRYYTTDLARRAHMIRRMREVGVPIESMRSVLDGPAEQATVILKEFARKAEESARHTATAIDDVVASLDKGSGTDRPVVVGVDGPELAAAIRRVGAAASAEPESPLGGVLLDISDGAITVAATDRYWLAAWTIPLPHTVLDEQRSIIAVDDIPGLARWLARQESVTMTADETNLRFTGDGEYAPETMMDRFPAYKILMDAETPSRGRATVDRPRLLAALGDDGSTDVLRLADDRVTVQSGGIAEGVRLPATTSGASLTIGFAAALLRTALSAMVGTEVTLAYESPDRAVRVTSPDQRRFVALVMPSKLNA